MTRSGPFVVRWLDGREEPLASGVMTIFDGEEADAWAEQRGRGAVGLLAHRPDGTYLWIDHNYTPESIQARGLGPGARVRHKRHPELTGRVERFEAHSPGRLSMIPLTVYWEQEDAGKKLGWFAIYQSPESLELLVEADADGLDR